MTRLPRPTAQQLTHATRLALSLAAVWVLAVAGWSMIQLVDHATAAAPVKPQTAAEKVARWDTQSAYQHRRLFDCQQAIRARDTAYRDWRNAGSVGTFDDSLPACEQVTR